MHTDLVTATDVAAVKVTVVIVAHASCLMPRASYLKFTVVIVAHASCLVPRASYLKVTVVIVATVADMVTGHCCCYSCACPVSIIDDACTISTVSMLCRGTACEAVDPFALSSRPYSSSCLHFHDDISNPGAS